MVIRAMYLYSGLLLVGLYSFLWLAGPSSVPQILAWKNRLTRSSRWLILILLVATFALLAQQAVIVGGQVSAAWDLSTLQQLLSNTLYGRVWTWRFAVLVPVLVLVCLGSRMENIVGQRMYCGSVAVLAGAAMIIACGAGHSAAVEDGREVALAVSALHLGAAAIWFGGLIPLALLMRTIARTANGEAVAFGTRALGHFARLAPVAMAVVIGCGLGHVWLHIGSIAALLGTDYGQLVLGKVMLLAPVLIAGLAIRRRLLPKLAIQPGAANRVFRLVIVEIVVALGIIALAAALVATPPARHETPVWPLPFRLAFIQGSQAPRVTDNLSWAGTLLLLAAVVFALGLRREWRFRWVAMGLGGAGLATGVGAALAPYAVEAYPTTYQRPSIPYHAISISDGAALFSKNCVACHGENGRGDGPASRGLPRPAADLTLPHTGDHTAGDIFWWLGNGMPKGGMPGFRDQLSEDERWDLINFLRALAAANSPWIVDATVQRHPWMVAPDFTYYVRDADARTLKDHRNREAVILVFFSWPQSAQLLARLARGYHELRSAGAEVLAVPLGTASNQPAASDIAPLPMVAESQREIVRTYALFHGQFRVSERVAERPMPAHAEFLIDQWGYIRARWGPGRGSADWSNLATLIAEVRKSYQYPGMPPDDHVH